MDVEAYKRGRMWTNGLQQYYLVCIELSQLWVELDDDSGHSDGLGKFEIENQV